MISEIAIGKLLSDKSLTSIIATVALLRLIHQLKIVDSPVLTQNP